MQRKTFAAVSSSAFLSKLLDLNSYQVAQLFGQVWELTKKLKHDYPYFAFSNVNFSKCKS